MKPRWSFTEMISAPSVGVSRSRQDDMQIAPDESGSVVLPSRCVCGRHACAFTITVAFACRLFAPARSQFERAPTRLRQRRKLLPLRRKLLRLRRKSCVCTDTIALAPSARRAPASTLTGKARTLRAGCRIPCCSVRFRALDGDFVTIGVKPRCSCANHFSPFRASDPWGFLRAPVRTA